MCSVGGFHPGGFATLSIRIYNPPYNYPLCRIRIENPNTQTIGLQIRLNGKSVRAEKQVRDANRNPHKKADQPYTSKIVSQVPKQRNARKKILKWEATNAQNNRATLDPDLHKIP